MNETPDEEETTKPDTDNTDKDNSTSTDKPSSPVQTGDVSLLGALGLTVTTALGAMKLTKNKKNK